MLDPVSYHVALEADDVSSESHVEESSSPPSSTAGRPADKTFEATVVPLLKEQGLSEIWLAQSSAGLVAVAAQACLDVSKKRSGGAATLQSVFA